MTLFIRRNYCRIYGKILYRDCLKNFTQEIIFYINEIIEINKDFNQQRKRRIKAKRVYHKFWFYKEIENYQKFLLENISKYNKDLDT